MVSSASRRCRSSSRHLRTKLCSVHQDHTKQNAHACAHWRTRTPTKQHKHAHTHTKTQHHKTHTKTQQKKSAKGLRSREMCLWVFNSEPKGSRLNPQGSTYKRISLKVKSYNLSDICCKWHRHPSARRSVSTSVSG